MARMRHRHARPRAAGLPKDITAGADGRAREMASRNDAAAAHARAGRASGRARDEEGAHAHCVLLDARATLAFAGRWAATPASLPLLIASGPCRAASHAYDYCGRG